MLTMSTAVVVDQWLYIDGGEYYLLDNGVTSVIDSMFKSGKCFHATRH